MQRRFSYTPTMARSHVAAMLALSVLLLAGGAFAQEEAEIDPSIAEAVKSAAAQARPASHPLTNMPPPVPTVETAFVFPKYASPKPQFPAGKISLISYTLSDL
jgi:hypothetical protein